MDYFRGWRTFREDPEFTSKLLTAAVVFLSASCVPLVGQLVLGGWIALVVRRAVRTDLAGGLSPDPYRQEPLFGANPIAGTTAIPRLDFDLNYLFKYVGSGFKVMIARLVYVFPMTLLIVGGAFCLYAGLFGAVFAGASTGSRDVMSALGVGATAILGLFALLMPVVMILSMALARVASMRVQVTDDLSQAMKLKEVFEDAKLLAGDLILLHFVQGFIGMLALLAGMLLCGVGMYAAIIVVMVMQGYHDAELYRIYLSKGGRELPLGPLDVEGP